MAKLLFLLLSLIAIVLGDHSDHVDKAHTVVSNEDSSDGHHVREHSEDDHQRSSDNGNIRGRNGEKHEGGLMAMASDEHIRGEDWSADDVVVKHGEEAIAAAEGVDLDEEDVAEEHSDHERTEDVEEHPDHEAVENEEEHPDHEDGGDLEEHPDHEKLKEDDGDDAAEDHERAFSEDEHPELEYAGQGVGDERKRGTFDRDEAIEGRHDVFESPQEDHVEDHEGLFGEDGEAEDHEDALSEEESENVDDEESENVEVVDDGEPEQIETVESAASSAEAASGAVIVGHLNENRDLEGSGVDEEEGDKPVLEYAGQGAADERARGTFDRDEDIEGRHDVFESPQEDHVEPDHENLHFEGTEMEEEEEGVDGAESELVAMEGVMERVGGKHFVVSTAVLMATGMAMALFYVVLITKRNAKTVAATETEETPLIADKV